MRVFFENHKIPLALDESFNEISSWEDIKITKAGYLIIKASRFSSVYQVLALAQKALERNIKPVFSTCFESAYSTAMYALLAADLALLDHAHGLWVHNFFEIDHQPNPFINTSGHLYLSEILRYAKSFHS